VKQNTEIISVFYFTCNHCIRYIFPIPTVTLIN